MLRGLRDPATLTKATGPSGAKVLHMIEKLDVTLVLYKFVFICSFSDLSIPVPIYQLQELHYHKSVLVATFLE